MEIEILLERFKSLQISRLHLCDCWKLKISFLFILFSNLKFHQKLINLMKIAPSRQQKSQKSVRSISLILKLFCLAKNKKKIVEKKEKRRKYLSDITFFQFSQHQIRLTSMKNSWHSSNLTTCSYFSWFSIIFIIFITIMMQYNVTLGYCYRAQRIVVISFHFSLSAPDCFFHNL